MNHKYIVTLTDDERNMLRELIAKGRTQGYRIKHAQILLKLDELPENREWTYAKIKEAYHATPHTICYNHCEKNVPVMDNLNIHSISSLYKAFEPAQARRIIQRLEIHYTPIHASWLNMAEIEIGILSRQCLSQSLVSFQKMNHQVNAWTLNRNTVCSIAHWRFSSDDTRCKLRKLYPVIF